MQDHGASCRATVLCSVRVCMCWSARVFGFDSRGVSGTRPLRRAARPTCWARAGRPRGARDRSGPVGESGLLLQRVIIGSAGCYRSPPFAQAAPDSLTPAPTDPVINCYGRLNARRPGDVRPWMVQVDLPGADRRSGMTSAGSRCNARGGTRPAPRRPRHGTVFRGWKRRTWEGPSALDRIRPHSTAPNDTTFAGEGSCCSGALWELDAGTSFLLVGRRGVARPRRRAADRPSSPRRRIAPSW